jgi:Arabinose efflux permease
MLIAAQARKHSVLLAILIGAFSLVLTNSAFNTLLPSFVDTYGISTAHGGWIITLYMLAMTITMPLTSIVVDRLGRKRTYMAGLGLYGLFSMVGGLFYQHVEVILLVRVMHGVAAGLMIPVSLVLLFDYYGQGKRGQVVGAWGMLLTIAPMIGPTLGGLVMQFGELKVLFWINVPFALLSFLLCSSLIQPYEPANRKTIHLQGLLLLILSVASLSLAIQFTSKSTISGWQTGLLFGIGVLSVIRFIQHENRKEEPLIRYKLLRHNRLFTVSLIISTVQDAVMFGVIFVMPLIFQEGLHLSPSASGALFIPTAVCTSLFVWMGGRWLDAGKSLRFIAYGIGMVALSVLSFAFVSTSVSLVFVIVLMTLRGIGNGLSDMTMTAIGLQALPEEDMHEGSALSNTLQRLASSFAVMLLAAYYDIRWTMLANSGIATEQARWMALQEECIMLGVLISLTLPLVVFINHKKAGAAVTHEDQGGDKRPGAGQYSDV